MSFGGFNFGASKTTAGAGGFSFNPPSQSTVLGATPSTTTSKPQALGFTFGQTSTAVSTSATPGFTLGTPATSVTTGFTLGSTPAQAGTAVGLAAPTTSAPSLGLLGTSSTALSTTPGFGFAKPTSVTSTAPQGFSLGGFGKPATTTTSTGLGFKLGGTTAGLTNTSASIFNQTPAKTATTGLGGVDPKTATTSASNTGDGSKTSEGKTVKEQMVEANIIADMEAFKKFMKDEKTEEEHIKRLSSTPMIKVQEDNIALRQLLSVVSSGLQRNACAVDKLKKQMTQELQNAEMAIRTKETPVGLQYENMAPTQYFHALVESFETQMLTYRQQIEMLESHLASLHEPNRLKSDELVMLLRKLHEAFIAMAAQLQQVHESVKTQKEHYLSYRKVFLGDSRNIFERQKAAPVKVKAVHPSVYGQSPFPGIQDAAAVAMASALNRSQQPHTQTGAPPVTGFTQSTGFGSNPGTSSFGSVGLGGFGSTASTGFKGFGTGTATGGGSLFGNTSSVAPTQSSGIFNSSFPALGTVQPALNLSTSTEQPFQLNKPPVGSKRGKR